MSPAALGDALLAAGHPMIIRAAIAPVGMEAPGPPWLTRIELTSVAEGNGPQGFCVRHRYSVSFADLGPWTPDDANPEQQANRPTALVDEIAYRLPIRTGCDPRPDAAYFIPEAKVGPRALTIVRLIEDATRRAAHHAPPFPVAVDDELDRQMLAFVRNKIDPQPTDAARYAVITDPRKALAALPIGDTTYVGHQFYDGNLLTPDVLRGDDGVLRERWKLYSGGSWTIDVVLNGDRIAAMKMRNRIPPPF